MSSTVRRNPHVFGPEVAVRGPYSVEEIEELWAAAKAGGERERAE